MQRACSRGLFVGASDRLHSVVIVRASGLLRPTTVYIRAMHEGDSQSRNPFEIGKMLKYLRKQHPGELVICRKL